MTTYASADLARILDLHHRWLHGEDGGTRADLTRADLTRADLTDAVLTDAVLRGAVLRGADLTRADLTRADLRGAVLRGADLTRADLRGAVLSDCVTWEEYLCDVVPALLCAGGKPLSAVATEETWACHDWNNCPMATAFDVHTLDRVPALYRWQAARFVEFFDAGLIPLPTTSAEVTP